jgi:phage baseplate assembly protein W
MPETTRTYSDIDVSFEPHPITGDILKKTGSNAVVQALANLIQLNHYEKPFHPEIGGNIRKLLFEPADPLTLSLLSEEIKNLVANFEPRVNLINVIVESDVDAHQLNVTLEFFILNNPNPLTITVFLQRLR